MLQGAQFLGHPIRQVAYLVDDIRTAAKAHSEAFGSGPFFVKEHIELCTARYRGQPGTLDHSSAYGQWGDVMIELVAVHGDAPSVFSDLLPGGRPGFHHVALIVDDLPSAMAEFEAKGMAEGFYGEVAPGVGFAMMDATASFGHFVELYEGSPVLLGIYEHVRNAAQGFDGTDRVREFDAF